MISLLQKLEHHEEVPVISTATKATPAISRVSQACLIFSSNEAMFSRLNFRFGNGIKTEATCEGFVN